MRHAPLKEVQAARRLCSTAAHSGMPPETASADCVSTTAMKAMFSTRSFGKPRSMHTIVRPQIQIASLCLKAVLGIGMRFNLDCEVPKLWIDLLCLGSVLGVGFRLGPIQSRTAFQLAVRNFVRFRFSTKTSYGTDFQVQLYSHKTQRTCPLRVGRQKCTIGTSGCSLTSRKRLWSRISAARGAWCAAVTPAWTSDVCGETFGVT